MIFVDEFFVYIWPDLIKYTVAVSGSYLFWFVALHYGWLNKNRTRAVQWVNSDGSESFVLDMPGNTVS